MLVYDPDVQAVAGNAALGESVRYLAQRWAELLDPATHYSRAAASLVDPLTAVHEYGATADGFLGRDGTRYDAVIEWSRRLRDVLRTERNSPGWYRSEHRRLVSRLGNLLGSIPNHASQHAKEAEVRRRAGRIMRVELPELEQRLANVRDGYFARLLDQVCDAVLAPPASDQDWERYDSDLSYLASFVLAQGRDARRVCEACITSMCKSQTGPEAMSQFRGVLTRSQSSYRVALVLQGASSVPGAAGFGCTELRNSWPSGSAATNRRLRDFMRSHEQHGRAVALMVQTDAYDVEQARAIAISQAEGLQDHILAEHRLTEVRVRQEVLVHCQTTGELFTVGRRRSGIATARTLAPAPVPALRSSLRFYGEARHERANVMSVVHYWVGLEALVEGAQVQMRNGTWKGQGPGVYLPPHASTLMALTSAKNMVTNLWQMLRQLGRTHRPERWRELERWLGLSPGRKHVELKRWSELVVAADGATMAPTSLISQAGLNAAGAVLHQLAGQLGPFPFRRLAEVRRRLTNGGLLSNWVAGVRATSEVNLMRMKFMRHRAMHQAQFENRSAQQVRQAGHDILDGVYEVVPRWLPGRSAPWEVFRDARTRYEDLTVGWRNAAGGAPRFEPDQLVDP